MKYILNYIILQKLAGLQALSGGGGEDRGGLRAGGTTGQGYLSCLVMRRMRVLVVISWFSRRGRFFRGASARAASL